MSQNRPAIQLLSIALLIAVTTLVYSNSFQGQFTLDDFVNILNSQGIRTFTPSLEAIVRAASDGPNANRWLANLSFAVNFFLDGENTWGYHLVNLLVHLAGAVVFYLLALTTLSLPIFSGQSRWKNESALMAALLWAVHPLQTNGVTYIVQRMTSMASLLSLASLLCYARGRLTARVGLRQLLLFSCSLLFWLMAILSKENAYMLPVMTIAYELYFLTGTRTGRNFAKTALLAGGGAAILAATFFFFQGKDIFIHLLDGYAFRDFTMGERLLTESRVLFLYLSLIALPLPSRLNLNHEIILSRGLLDPPQTLASLAGLCVLLVLVITLFNRNRLLSFGLFWFLGNLVIESTVLPLELIYEHRLYLPSTFLLLGLTAAGFSLARNHITVFRTCLIVFLCLLSFWTWQRNRVWADNLTLWSDVAAKSPGSARAWNNLGTVYHDRKQYRKAEQQFLRSIRLAPAERQAYVSLGSLYISQKRYPEALRMLEAALARQKELAPARIYHYMGVIYSRTGRYREALTAAQKALQLNDEDPAPLITIGIAHGDLQEYDAAEAAFVRAEDSGLAGADLYNNWGTVAFRRGQVDRAIALFNRALAIDPDHAESHYNLGIAFGAKGMVEEARVEMRRAMELEQQ